MEMKIHLHPDVYDIVVKGKKNVEARVNDEKRKNLKIGDTLIFLKRPLGEESIKAVITDLKYFNSFEEMGKDYDMERLYLKEYTIDMWLNELKRFYSDDEIEKNGVVAIEFLIKN